MDALLITRTDEVTVVDKSISNRLNKNRSQSCIPINVLIVSYKKV